MLPAMTGCQSRPEILEPEPSAAPEEPPETLVGPAGILALLDAAEAAMEREHLTFPIQGSAADLFDAVLAVDPDNAQAQRGIERIVEYYLEMAAAAAQRNQLARARSMLERARLLDADHPAVQPTQIQINLLANANRRRLVLDRTQLSNRSVDLRQALKSLGVQARDSNCRAMIRVRSDAEGRWVYEQMKRAPGETRIRAQIQIGSPPLVELVCFHAG